MYSDGDEANVSCRISARQYIAPCEGEVNLRGTHSRVSLLSEELRDEVLNLSLSDIDFATILHPNIRGIIVTESNLLTRVSRMPLVAGGNPRRYTAR